MKMYPDIDIDTIDIELEEKWEQQDMSEMEIENTDITNDVNHTNTYETSEEDKLADPTLLGWGWTSSH